MSEQRVVHCDGNPYEVKICKGMQGKISVEIEVKAGLPDQARILALALYRDTCKSLGLDWKQKEESK